MAKFGFFQNIPKDSQMFPFLYKMFPFFTKCFKVISDLGTRFSAMDQMCLTSMQLTQYNLDLFQPILTNTPKGLF